MYAQLGNIRFEGLKGFNSVEETFGVNYAQHELIKNKPRLERVGDTLDKVSFEMSLHSSFTDPEADIDALRNAMKNGEILTLILGNGKVLGNFVIPNFTKSTTFTDAKGNLIAVTLSVELIEVFSEDPLRDAQKQAKNNAFATTSRNSNVRAVIAPIASPATALATNVAKIETSGVLVNQYVESADKNPNTYDYYSKKTNEALDVIVKNINEIEEKINDSTELSDGAPGLPGALQSLYSSVQNIKGILPISDISSFRALVKNLQKSISATQLANVNNSNQSVIRRK